MNPDNDSDKVPSVEEIEKICMLDEAPVVRNLQITQCYHDLSHAITRLVGDENCNWCNFATWASKTAGRFIRLEEIDDEIQDWLGQLPGFKRWWLESIERKLKDAGDPDEPRPKSIVEFIITVLGDVSGDIASGNLKVFSELGPYFSRLVDTFDGDTTYDEKKLDAFVSGLKPGSSESGGQERLRIATRRYYESRFVEDDHRKAELILIANGQVGLHEQIRLQPFIASSLDAPVEDGVRSIHDAVIDELAGFVWLVFFVLDLLLRPLITRDVLWIWERIMTRFFMELQLPDGTVHLGRDLPHLRGQPDFPPSLQRIDNAELAALLGEYKVNRSSLHGFRAEDWAVLTERMGLILELFRSRQEDQTLFDQPFSASQREAIIDGRVPDGPL